MVVIGAAHTVGSGPKHHANVKGYARGFDVRTGKRLWIFHTIPQKGEFGYDTWPTDAYQLAGGANAWAGLTVDPKLGMVFAATGSASFDFYGVTRHGDNLFDGFLGDLFLRLLFRVPPLFKVCL